MIERGGDDFALDVNVRSVTLRESTEQAEEEAAQAEEESASGADHSEKSGAVRKPEDPLKIYQMLLSNPWEDLENRLEPQYKEYMKHNHNQLKLQLFINSTK